MNSKNFILLAAIIVTLLAMSIGSASAPTGVPTVEDPEAWDRLAQGAIDRINNGEIVVAATRTDVKEKTYGVIGVFTVDVGIEEAFRVIKMTDTQDEYVEVIKGIALIERTDDHDIVEFKIKFLAFKINFRVIHKWDNDKFQLWWELDPSFNNGVRIFEGYYHLFYIDDDHTLVRYGANIRFVQFIPKAVQQLVVKHDLPNGLAEVRKRINSGGTYKIER